MNRRMSTGGSSQIEMDDDVSIVAPPSIEANEGKNLTVINTMGFGLLVSCVFILLSRESDQCAIRARLGVASHLSTTPRWRNPAKRLSQWQHNK